MNVLAVDDEKLVLKGLVEAIKQADAAASVVGVTKPAEALSYAEANSVSVAFLDIELGSTDGLTLAKKLLALQPDMNIIFVTGYSQYAVEAFSLFASGYVLKPVDAHEIGTVLKNLRHPVVLADQSLLTIQTFGNFEVFSKGEPLHFYRSKSKELLAYLVQKRGTSCTLREICAVLFEDRHYDKSLNSQIQTIISSLMKTLDEAGAKSVVIRKFNSLAIDTGKIDCDYYHFLVGELRAQSAYLGEFMSNYAWAETTNAFLLRKAHRSD